MSQQQLFDFLNFVLDPVLKPLLSVLSPFWFIIIITFLITLLITLIYKYTTNQELVKRLRDEMKEIQKQMKEYQHDVEKVKQLQKESFEKMGVQFRQNMKPMLITLIPMLIIFGWLANNLSYEPLKPGEEFSVEIEVKSFNSTVMLNVPEGLEILDENIKQADPVAKWAVKSKEGLYNLEFTLKSEKQDKLYVKEVVITNKNEYKSPVKIINDEFVKEIRVSNKPIKFYGLSWFWVYFILAVVFNSLIRKVLKVY